MNKNNLIKRFILLLSIGLSCMVPAYASSSDFKRATSLITPNVQVKPAHRREIIVLIHGLIRSTLSMYPLKSYLERQGYQVYSYSYPSARYTIQQHGAYLNQFINELLAKNPGVKIDFITHSLGGIITREALSKLTTKQLKNVGCLIMLAPPNQGSKLAKLSTKMFPLFTFPIKPLAELSSDKSSYVHRVPVPNIKIGIIAGRYDAKVPPEAARLDGQAEPVVINSTHTFIMNNAQTKKLITNFLERGTFKDS